MSNKKESPIRHPTINDLQAVLQIQRASRIHDFGSAGLTEADLLASWLSGKLALDADTWLATSYDGSPVAYAEITPDFTGDFWVTLHILPDHRHQGIEATLLSLAEKRITERQLPTHNQPITIFGRAFDANKSARQAYEQAGYNLNLSFQIMQIDLTQPPPLPAPQWPQGITPRPFNPAQDDHPTYTADEESAEDKGYHTPLTFDAWAERMGRNKPDFDPTLWFLAWHNDDLAAVCLNYYDRATNTGWIDHLGVRRPFRKQGLGMALLLHSFREFHARGVPTVKLSVDSGSLTNAPRLYTQAGMRIVQLYHIYRKILP